MTLMGVEKELSSVHWLRGDWVLGLGNQSVMAFKVMAFFLLCLTSKSKVHVFLNEGWLCLMERRREWTRGG